MSEIFDEADALEKTAGDRELMAEVIRFTLDDLPAILNDIKMALSEMRWNDAGRLAHKAKGSAGACGARALYLAALDLEMAGRDDDPATAGKSEALVSAFEAFRTHPEVLQIASLDLDADASIG